MRLLFLLIKLKFFSQASLLSFSRAKRIHGRNTCFLLYYAAARYSSKIALSDGTTRISFKEMYQQVLDLSVIINSKIKSFEQGTAILICSNSIRDILVHLAIQNLGLKLILVHHKNHPDEIKRIKDSQPSGTFIFSSSKDMADFPTMIFIDDLFNELPIKLSQNIISKKDPELNFSTSGTTGKPKIIVKKRGVFYWMPAFADLIFQTGAFKRNAVFISTPFSHAFGYTILMFALVLGKKTVFTNRKEQDYISSLIINEQIDLLTGVPASLYHIAKISEGFRHHVNLVICSGAPLNTTILQHITNIFGTNIFSLYGSTEASTSFVAGYHQLIRNCCALGKPLKGVKYRIGDRAGEGNELLINSPMANISSVSWVPTGDIVKTDTQKNLIWCGRTDDMILKNGVNIHPPEIENALLKTRLIEDAYVSGEKHPTKGEIIIAYIKLKPGYAFNDLELRSVLSSLLSAIKIPDKFIESPDFEYNVVGKKIKPAFRYDYT